MAPINHFVSYLPGLATPITVKVNSGNAFTLPFTQKKLFKF